MDKEGGFAAHHCQENSNLSVYLLLKEEPLGTSLLVIFKQYAIAFSPLLNIPITGADSVKNLAILQIK